MKHALLKWGVLLCIFLCGQHLRAGEKFSYGPDGRTEFRQANDKILIRFSPGMSLENKLLILKTEPQVINPEKGDFLPAPDVAVIRVNTSGEQETDALLQRLRSKQGVVYANPFLVYSDGTYQGVQDRILVRLKSDKDFGLLEKATNGFGAGILEQNQFDPLLYVVQTYPGSAGNALEIANRLAETRQFDYSEPDFLLLLKRFNTNDPNLSLQWSLNNTGSSQQYNGTAGADVQIFDAWSITTGSSSIKVAIIDEGVDLVHPDLAANMLAGYDATGQNSGGAPSGDDAHGTNCAGIVAAVGNNNTGVAGVAYSCKIIPVRIAYSNTSGNWVTSNTWIGNAINWAWQTANADVLSNSWGGGSSSSTINNAISGAVTSGRGGLGTPVLFAAGNNNGANSYPATLTDVISVIAMSMCYERKNPSSCDGETWWGSNYGTGADVAAPGVKIASTDISGSAGYSSGNYYNTFNGTSSATPNAAGVMALILSAGPGLTAAQARYTLESTCRKVGSYTYNSNVSGQPNGTWSNDLGYGLVSAYDALQTLAPQANWDAGVNAINAPAGSICSTEINPQVSIRNFGANTITSLPVFYQLDSDPVQTYTYNGSLSSNATAVINLPAITVGAGSHTFTAYTGSPNGQTDENATNNSNSSAFSIATNGVTLTIVLDNYPEETSWTITDGSGGTVAGGGTYASIADGSTLVIPVCLSDGCYTLNMYDQYGDGICCAYGSGSYVLTLDSDGSVLASGGQFGSSESTPFCVESTSSLTAEISSSGNVSCFGGNNGFASVSASGGTPPYTYNWSNGGTGASVTGLTAGTYTVNIEDALGATTSAQVTITQPQALNASAFATNINCNAAANGSIQISVTGGTSPYSFLWNDGSIAQSRSNLGPGSYSVTVTDANGCTASSGAVISQPTALNIIVTTLPTALAPA
ncbi:MAG: S8 family serine peptidase [Bacteroidia bacterium]